MGTAVAAGWVGAEVVLAGSSVALGSVVVEATAGVEVGAAGWLQLTKSKTKQRRHTNTILGRIESFPFIQQTSFDKR
jgi:hypothetical protein